MSFTQPWSSFVSDELLSRLTVEEKKRQEAIYELIGTEQSYVRDLQLIVEVRDLLDTEC